MPFKRILSVILLGTVLSACSTREASEQFRGSTSQRLLTYSINNLMAQLPEEDFKSFAGQPVYVRSHFIEASQTLNYTTQRLYMELTSRWQMNLVDSPEKARHVLYATGADGLLIGRAAQGRPWIFREIEHYLRTGEILPALALSEVERILLEHLAALHTFYGDVMGVRIARKHVGWYLATLPGAREFRALFNRLEDTQAQCANVREFFAERQKSPKSGTEQEVAA